MKILTSVSVPVLSEQMTETEPNVSTVFNDLHRTLFCRMMLAVMVRPAVRAMGKPSGMKAMATLTQLTMRVGTEIQPGWAVRSQAPLRANVNDPATDGGRPTGGAASTYQTTNTMVIMVIMMEVMMATKYRISRSRVVILLLGSLVSVAMRPKTVRSPVFTTRPTHDPVVQ